jgi:uncharacterized protein YcbK (DUF882 family)
MDRLGGAVLNRRSLIIAGAAVAAVSAVSLPTDALASMTRGVERVVALRNIHTGEETEVVYAKGGSYRYDALHELNRVMRDWRTDETRRMDPRLFDTLWMLSRKLKTRSPFELISGYRSPETNAMLASKSDGVATKSYHMRGMAADIASPDATLGRLRRVALDMGAGGVGYYPRSGFVHVDVGPIRHW